MSGLVVAYLQSVRGNHAVEAHFAGQSVELVAVGVGGSVHVNVVFGYLSGYLFSVRRHIVFGVFRCLVFGKGGGCHAENGDG